MTNYYDTLGVSQKATDQEIKKAYRELIKKYHPDKNPNDAKALETTKLLIEAYTVLRNPLKRKEYDNLLSLRGSYQKERAYSQEKTATQQTRTADEPIHHYCCEKCKKQDTSLRVSIFLRVISLFVVTQKKAYSYILCNKCRLKYSLLFNLEVLFFGWWGFPWGPAYSIEALYENLKGGEQSKRNNETLLNILSYDFYRQGRYADAYECLQQSIKIERTKEKEEFINYIKSLSFQKKTQNPVDKYLLHPVFCNILLIFFLPYLAYVFFSSSATSTHENYPIPSSSVVSPKNYSPASAPLPDIKTGYLKGFKQKRKGGYTTLTVDNTQNDDGVIAKIFYLGGAKPAVCRVFSIRGGDKFTARNIAPGDYDVRYKILSSNEKYKTQTITLHQSREENSIRYSNVELTLYKVINGNMHTSKISDDDFDIDETSD